MKEIGVLIVVVVISLMLVNLSKGDTKLASDLGTVQELNSVVINEVVLDTTPPIPRWVELYNKGSVTVTLRHLTLYFSEVYCPFHLASVITIKPHAYIIFTSDKTNFTKYWDVKNNADIYEGPLPDTGLSGTHGRGYIWLSTDKGILDSMEKNPPYYYPNHSWARYRGGYDTDNFTNDFYDEPYPTPGYENHLAKGSPPLILTATLLDSKIKLRWYMYSALVDDNATIIAYRIYRGTAEDPLEVITTVNSTVNEYIDYNVTMGEKYYYALCAITSVGEIYFSDIVSIEIPNEVDTTIFIGFAAIIVVIAIVMYVRYRKKREK